jgi:serine phosphatase RsbU (regulator of sigma subunit)
LFIYSDGLTETMNAQHEQFGVSRLAEVCARRESCELQACLDTLVKKASEFRGDEPVADDISALALQIAPL